MAIIQAAAKPALPILLFDGTCAICRRLGHWVQTAAHSRTGEPTLIVRAIGDDPKEIRSLHPGLTIWAAYATVHVLMPDGSMLLSGEAVAEIFRRSPKTAWFAGLFALRVFGWQPFQAILDLGYDILQDGRPLLGCESCGTPAIWVGKIKWLMDLPKTIFGNHRPAKPHFTHRHATRPQTAVK